MKKILGITLVSLILLLGFTSDGKTKVKNYYSGDAIHYNNQMIIASANTGSLEIFKEEDGVIKRITKFQPFDPNTGRRVDFFNLELSKEANRLYVYLVADYTLYKYDITDPTYPVLVKREKNTFWEWYGDVNKNGNEILVSSEKGVRVFNTALQSLDFYPIANKKAYNISAESSGSFLLNNNDNYLQLYDRFNRSVTKSISVSYKSGHYNENHRALVSTLKNEVFVIDDSFVKKFDVNGSLQASFRHLDYSGYDVVLSGDGNYVYVSNGIGVMKFRTSDLSLDKYKFTSTIAGPAGWAMGIKMVATPDGEKLVVFNNASILVLDKDLKDTSFFQSTEADEEPELKENVFLNVERIWGVANGTVLVNGGGYFPYETLEVIIARHKTEITADYNGRFQEEITIPDVDPIRTDIKVTGTQSNQSYSISFEIK